MEKDIRKLRLLVMDIFTSGMFDRCEPAVLYKFMMLNLILIVGTPFVLGFGLFDVYRGIEPLGYIISAAGLACVGCFVFLRKTKNYTVVSYFLIFVLFWMFLYLLSTGGSGNSGLLWYYSFTPIALFLLGFRKGSATVFASLAVAGVILFWPGTPFLFTTYSDDIKIRFIPSVVVLWAVTSLFEHVKAVALKIEIKNTELKESVEELGEAREALSSEKEKLAVTLHSIGDGVIASDTNGKITLMNTVAERLTGWSQEEAAGRPVEEVVRIRDRKSHEPCGSLLTMALKDGKGVAAKEYRVLLDRNDRERLISDIGAPILDKDGRIIGAVLVFRDVTDQVRMEEDLQRTSKLESVGLLAGGIAHDFNNILTTIKGAVYILAKNIDTRSPLKTYPEQILASIKKGADLAQSLLAFSRKQTMAVEPLDVNELIHESLALLRRLLGEHIEIVLKPDERSPMIMADRNQIQQVLINLAANARDAMPGGGRLTIMTGLVGIDPAFIGEKGFGRPGKHVVVEVSDTGSGIEQNIREKIFEPFFTTKGMGEGSGLGLAVTYGIVKQHKGFIDFDSTPGKGTAFRMYFPSEKGTAVSPEAVKSVPDHGGTGKKTILLAEDDSDVRKIIEDILMLEGYSVIRAKDGVEAIALFRQNREIVDLALLDVRMPGKNGREVYNEIKKLAPGTAVLFMSGYTEDIIDSDGILREGLSFISKSAAPEEILQKIRQAV